MTTTSRTKAYTKLNSRSLETSREKWDTYKLYHTSNRKGEAMDTSHCFFSTNTQMCSQKIPFHLFFTWWTQALGVSAVICTKNEQSQWCQCESSAWHDTPCNKTDSKTISPTCELQRKVHTTFSSWFLDNLCPCITSAVPCMHKSSGKFLPFLIYYCYYYLQTPCKLWINSQCSLEFKISPIKRNPSYISINSCQAASQNHKLPPEAAFPSLWNK